MVFVDTYDILTKYTDPSVWADSELKSWLERVRISFYILLVPIALVK